MARGKHYSQEENDRMMKVIEAHPGKKYVELAQMCKDFGACSPNRSLRGVACRVARLVQGDTHEETPEDAKGKNAAPDEAFVGETVQLQISDELYEGLKREIFNTATDLFEPYGTLRFDIRSLNSIIRNRWPEEYQEKVRMMRNAKKREAVNEY